MGLKSTAKFTTNIKMNHPKDLYTKMKLLYKSHITKISLKLFLFLNQQVKVAKSMERLLITLKKQINAYLYRRQIG